MSVDSIEDPEGTYVSLPQNEKHAFRSMIVWSYTGKLLPRTLTLIGTYRNILPKHPLSCCATTCCLHHPIPARTTLSIRENLVEKEVSENAFKHFRRLCKWLYGPDCLLDVEYRVAPSIVTRSEAEMFGLSTPRFAFRTILSNGSVFNLRRLNTLASRIEVLCELDKSQRRLIQEAFLKRGLAVADAYLSVPEKISKLRYYLVETDLGSYLGEAADRTCIPYLNYIEMGGGLCAQAASFLSMLQNHRYAKSVLSIPEISYVASQLVNSKEEIQEIEMHGLNEETTERLLSDSRVGLNAWRECEILSSTRRRIPAEKKTWDAEKVAVTSYLRSGFPLILPIDDRKLFQPHSRGKKSVFSRNEVNGSLLKIDVSESQLSDGNSECHMVLLGGCSADGGGYILHDPASFPFLKCSWEDLLFLRRPKFKGDDDQPDFFRFLPVVPRDVEAHLLQRIVSVSDSALHKESSLVNAIHPKSDGLLQIAESIQRGAKKLLGGRDLPTVGPGEYDPGTFFLLKWNDTASRQRFKVFLNKEWKANARQIDKALEKVLSDELLLKEMSKRIADCVCGERSDSEEVLPEYCEKFGQSDQERESGIRANFDPKNRWVWIQIREDGFSSGNSTAPAIWVWDAQHPLPPKAEYANISELVLGILPGESIAQLENFGSVEQYNQSTATEGQRVILNDSKKKWPPGGIEIDSRSVRLEYLSSSNSCSTGQIEPAIISSFSTKGTLHALRQLQNAKVRSEDDVKNCEVYLMMEPEVRSWRQKIFKNSVAKSEDKTGAAEFLASLNRDQCREIAAVLARRFKQRGFEIVAVATFLPEVARHFSEEANPFVSAMLNVGRIVGFIRNDSAFPHAIQCVEMVGGSLIKSLNVKPGHKRQNRYAIKLEDRDRCRANFIENLSEVMRRTEVVENKRSSNVWPKEVLISVELEPGLFFLINDWNSLVELEQKISGCSELSDGVGFNLDIAHWQMAGIRPKLVKVPRQNPFHEVRSRLCHVHLSGHHTAAHFGDIRPLLGEDRQISKDDFVDWLRFYESCLDMPNVRGFHGSGFASLEFEAAPTIQQVRLASLDLVDILNEHHGQ